MFNNKYLSILFIVLCTLLNLSSRANDSLKLKAPVFIQNIGLELENNYYRLNRKDISTPFPRAHASLFNWILLDKMPTGGYNPSYPWELKFTNCSFSIHSTPFKRIKSNSISKYLLFDSCLINYLSLTSLTKNATIINSTIRVLEIDSAENCELRFNSNSSLKTLIIENSKNIRLDFQNNYHQDSSRILINHCSIKNILFVPSYATESEYYFYGDTIINNVSTPITPFENVLKSNKTQSFHFRDCYIDADFWNFGEYYNSSLIFENCSFGPKAYLGSLGMKKLSFINCRNTPTQLPLGFSNDSTVIALSFINTDVNNFKFDFPENVTLVLDSNYKKDVGYNTFVSLLNKYRAEGKHDSYMHVDIQYKNFTQSKIENWLNKVWWYYGYRKYYVFYWVLVVLIIFSIINFKKWDRLKVAYPIIEEKKSNYYESINFKYRKETY